VELKIKLQINLGKADRNLPNLFNQRNLFIKAVLIINRNIYIYVEEIMKVKAFKKQYYNGQALEMEEEML
jgi:hypothetical protein